jgi:hypothetical protein
MLKRTLRNIYVPNFSKSSGENWDQGLAKCIRAHWADKKNKSRRQSNKRWLATGKHERIINKEVLPEDCPPPMLYNSKMYPEAIMYTLFHDHNCLRLQPNDTTARVLAAAADSNADDAEILAIVQSTKKTKGQHKSRAQIKREEANKRKLDKQNETKAKLAKKIMTEDAYARKADAAFQHAGAASRQQELESIMFAAKLEIYTKEELKVMMDKHLKQTFHSNAAYEKVIDLTQDEIDLTKDEEAEDNAAQSRRNPSLDILTQTEPHTFQSPPIAYGNTDSKPAAQGSNNSSSTSNSGGINNNNNMKSSGRQDGVSKQLFSNKQDMQDDYDAMGLAVLGDIAYKEQHANSVKAREQVIQPTLTQGGMNWLVPVAATEEGGRKCFPVLADYETRAGMVVLDGELCCAGEDHCFRPLVKSSMQCSNCKGYVHLDCAISREDQTVACGRCFELMNRK